MKAYRTIAQRLMAIKNCQETDNAEWEANHRAVIQDVVDDGPSGSGIDTGTKFGEASTPNRLVFHTSYHHMNEGGSYDGWTDHDVIVTPSLAFSFVVRVTGRNRNDIKDYLAEVYAAWLETDVPQPAPAPASTT